MYSSGLGLYALVVTGTALWIHFKGDSLNDRWERRAFWILSIPLLAFTAFRPYGIANDDFAYFLIFKQLCPIQSCGQWIQSDRDLIWYTLLAWLKAYWPETRMVLMVSAVCLLVKLVIIFKLSRHCLLGLLAYVVMFYPIYDLTAFRVSMSVMVYMLGFWLLVRCCALAGLPYLLINGFVHKQAFVSPAVLVGGLFGYRWSLFPVVCVLLLGMVLIGFYPSHALFQNFHLNLDTLGLSDSALAKDLWTYFNQQQLGHYDKLRRVPLVLYPVFALAFWLSKALFQDDRRLYSFAAGSMALAAGTLWLLASLPEVQMRFVHFFLVPLVFLVGNHRHDHRTVLAVVAVALIFIIRYDFLHPILASQCTLDWVGRSRTCEVPVW